MRILLPALALLAACRLSALDREYGRITSTFTHVKGTVHTPTTNSRPIIVAAFQEIEGEMRPVNYDVLVTAGEYGLWLPRGKYRLFAFEDRNHDFIRDPNEPLGELRDGVEFGPGATLLGMDIELRKNVENALPIDLSASGGSQAGTLRPRVGEVVSMDDPRFRAETGTFDMWRPVSAFGRDRVGVFLLEAYDPCRTPVLFVHGIQGSPQDLRPMMEALDKTRFQAWFYHYPSGLRLAFSAGVLGDAIRQLGVKHEPERMFVVAHSMGGLVSRAFINDNVALKKRELIRLFVSVASPFNGHESAESGVILSPVVVPAWIDMVPDSEFIQKLHNAKLPSYVDYHMLFGYDGSLGRANDGSVMLESVLDPRVQSIAKTMYGYEETHTSILEAQPAIDRVMKILNTRDDTLGPLCPSSGEARE